MECSILPILCFSHLSKNLKADINEHYEDKTVRGFIAALIGGMFEIDDVRVLDNYIKKFLTLLSVPIKDSMYNLNFIFFRAHFKSSPVRTLRVLSPKQNIIEWQDFKSIYASSKFHQFYSSHVHEVRDSVKSTEERLAKRKLVYKTAKKPLRNNEFASAQFVDVFTRKYLSILPMWSIFISKMRDKTAKTVSELRGNNGAIEKYFHELKEELDSNELEFGSRNMKIGRYVQFQSKFTGSRTKAILCDVNTKRLNYGGVPNTKEANRSQLPTDRRSQMRHKRKNEEISPTENNLGSSQEMWSKKIKRSRVSKVFLKKKLNFDMFSPEV